MNCVAPAADVGREADKSPLNLKVLVLYEDYARGLRARHALDRVVRQLEPDADLDVSLWRFDMLREPDLRREAAREAAEADIVFVSAKSLGDLPGAAHLWFQEWFRQRGDSPGALAVSVDSGTRAASSANGAFGALSHAARRAGVDLFLHLDKGQPGIDPELGDLRHRAETTTLLLDELLRRPARPPMRDWGINE